MTSWIALAVGGILAAAGIATDSSVVREPSRCASMPGAPDQVLTPSRALYCMDFVPMSAPSGGGAVELRRVSTSPFTVSVDADGHELYDLVTSLAELPDPHALGPYSAYVAWATTATLDRERKLGQVRNGRTDLGIVGYDRYVVTITAERSAQVTTRTGRVILSATSPGWQLQAHDDIAYWGSSIAPHDHGHMDAMGWRAPLMDPRAPIMAPGIAGLVPDVAPWNPHPVADTARVPPPSPRQVISLLDGDSLHLTAGLIRRTLAGRTMIMYGFNGQSPGPLIRVTRGSTIIVNFTNELDQPTTIHWHGVRLDNRFDGTPHVTQELVPRGGRFRYVVHFPDAGVFWYHPHQREDEQQNLGLYGNVYVVPAGAGGLGAANREQFLTLSDLLLDSAGAPVPYGADSATHALMGRLGNLLLVNGTRGYTLRVARGEVVRFILTNTSNSRVFNVSFPGTRMKVVGGDIGPLEREVWVPSVVLAPAERYLVEVRFGSPGRVPFVNHVQAIDHYGGRFFDDVDTLGVVAVASTPAVPDLARGFATLRVNADVTREIESYRSRFPGPPDHTLVLTNALAPALPFAIAQALRVETSYANPVEWSATMPVMDWVPTSRDVRWILRDAATGRENMDIGWRFRQGDMVHLRLVNDRQALHAMQHPIHLHGQRFLVLAVNGDPMQDLSWKDTVLVPAGATVDLLVEMTNPGRWMLHCHIAEHLESGMHTVIDVAP